MAASDRADRENGTVVVGFINRPCTSRFVCKGEADDRSDASILVPVNVRISTLGASVKRNWAMGAKGKNGICDNPSESNEG